MSVVSKLLAKLTNNSEISSYFTDYMGIVSVATYGGIGDNATDATQACEDAKDAADALGNKGIYFPKGVYKVDASLDFTGYFLWGDDASFNGISTPINQIGNWMNATAGSIIEALIAAKAVSSGKLADDVQVGSLDTLSALITGAARLSITAAINALVSLLIDAAQKGTYTYAATATGNDTYVVTLAPAITALTTGMSIRVKVDVGNTGACSINPNGIGAIAIKKLTDSGLADTTTGDMVAGGIYNLFYDGTYLQLANITGANIPKSLFTARGMFIRSSAANTPEVVAIGTSGKSLMSDGTDVVYGYPENPAYGASDNVILTANTERIITGTSYGRLKSFRAKYSGTVRLKFEIHSNGDTAQVGFDDYYANPTSPNVIANDSSGSYVAKSADVYVTSGQLYSLWGRVTAGSYGCYLRNLTVCADISASADDNAIID